MDRRAARPARNRTQGPAAGPTAPPARGRRLLDRLDRAQTQATEDTTSDGPDEARLVNDLETIRDGAIEGK
jgi:hypothetical protein